MMDVTFFEDVPFYPSPNISSSSPTHSFPLPMIDLPSSSSDNQPEYQRKGSTTQSAGPPIPSHN